MTGLAPIAGRLDLVELGRTEDLKLSAFQKAAQLLWF